MDHAEDRLPTTTKRSVERAKKGVCGCLQMPAACAMLAPIVGLWRGGGKPCALNAQRMPLEAQCLSSLLSNKNLRMSCNK